MALSTFSIFYTLNAVTNANNKLNFDETAGELTATIVIGAFPPSEIIGKVKTAMDAVSVTNTFTVTLDRDTRLVTIASDVGNFELLLATGSQLGISIFPLLGFNQGVDLTGAMTYTGDTAIGSTFEPQFILQDFVSEDDQQEKVDPSVNESAEGILEVISFGINKFIELNSKFITNIVMDGKIIKNNPTGVADAQAFMQFITNKATFEFMKDIDVRSTFLVVVLESTPVNRQGTGYRLEEQTRQNLPNIFETGRLKLRVV